MKQSEIVPLRRTAALLCLVLAAVLFVPAAAKAQENGKVVRVGWYRLVPTNALTSAAGAVAMPMNTRSSWPSAIRAGPMRYTSGSWLVPLEMLETGEIDLMSDVSYTEERTEYMLYSSLPMGSEEYHLFVRRITARFCRMIRARRTVGDSASTRAACRRICTGMGRAIRNRT